MNQTLNSPPTGAVTAPAAHGLTDEEKARIRAEEVYREEVRKQLLPSPTGISKILAFLNSPFGIYILTSILLSGATYLYTQHKELKDKQRDRREEITKLADEIGFRERQLDDALKIAEQSGSLLRAPQFSPDMDGSAFSLAYRVQCEEVGAVVKVGGLVSPPGDLTGVEFRDRDVILDNKLLIYRQGYKYPEYKFSNLTDLGAKKWALEHAGAPASSSDIAALDSSLSDLDDAAFIVVRATVVWTHEVTSDPVKIASIIAPRITEVRKKFEAVRQNPLLQNASVSPNIP